MNILPLDHCYFYTNDKVKLHYIDKGEGLPIVMISSWTMSAEQYQAQILFLSQKYRVIALDMRGHGQSQKVDYGYKVYRFAKDLHELLQSLLLENVIALGHSVGGSVLFCYWELFAGERINKLILVDRPVMTVANPFWTPLEVRCYGAGMDSSTAMEVMNMIASSGSMQYKTVLLNCMLSKPISLRLRAWLLDASQLVPNQQAAILFYDDVHQDWRDILPSINIPTLIIAGRASPISVSSQVWLHQQIQDSTLVIFEEEEGGKHFPFIDNAMKFNHVIDDFLQEASAGS